jgi:surfactin synthase thioesterase subunit
VSTWLQRLDPRPAADRRLFCFHHAGGSASAFRLWPQRLPQFDVVAIQLPGRANRFLEAALTDMEEIIERLLPDILALLDRPYALFGHSMGTAVASALVHRLREVGAAPPAHLFMSGRQPVHRPFPQPSLRGLTDAEVVRVLDEQFGGIPPEVMQYPELIEIALPALRSDFEVLERYRPLREAPLNLPITALGGLDDPWSARHRLQAWQDCTTQVLDVQMFPGGHFYIDACLDAVLQLVRGQFRAEPACADSLSSSPRAE